MENNIIMPQEPNEQLPSEESELSPEEKQAQLKAKLCAIIAQLIREHGKNEQYSLHTHGPKLK